MSTRLIYAVHGFLGQLDDWQEIEEKLPESAQMIGADLFSEDSEPIESFEWTVDDIADEVESEEPADKNIFIGYSLGGRIGLHVLETDPDLFDHYIFLSTNPGFPENALDERKQRLQQDQQWAQKLSSGANFINEWNQQKVFEGSAKDIERDIEEYDVAKLKQALTIFSLAWQKDFSQVIRAHQSKITWVVGDRDAKYVQIAEDLKQKKILLDYKRISSGHRVWLEQPDEVVQLLLDC